MKELFSLADTLITDLLTLADPALLEQISADVDNTNLLSTMFGLLATIVEFKDLRGLFQRMTI